MCRFPGRVRGVWLTKGYRAAAGVAPSLSHRFEGRPMPAQLAGEAVILQIPGHPTEEPTPEFPKHAMVREWSQYDHRRSSVSAAANSLIASSRSLKISFISA